MVEIVQKGNKTLRKIAKEVPLSDIKTAKFKKTLADMKRALDSQHDGVAIAAPQIGISLRIFLISGRVIAQLKQEESAEPLPADKLEKTKDLIFINPKISKLSKKSEMLLEGCLSVRPLWGEVKRSTNTTIEAYDEQGKKFSRGAGGLMAQIFQHETDHLEGVLFVDKAV